MDNVLNKQQRVGYLDMLKGLGMFIIVSGHLHNEYGWFSLPLHAFAIPMYFMLSGMTFKREKFNTLWDLVKRRSKTLLLPYVMFAILTWLLWAVWSPTGIRMFGVLCYRLWFLRDLVILSHLTHPYGSSHACS